MADLEDGGFLYQPHTSAGRVPTAAAYRFFAQEIATQATLSIEDRDWIRREFAAANNRAEITERAGHVLAEVSNGLGIVVSPPLGKTVLEHARIWLAARRARGGGADFAGRSDAGQSFASATRFYAARSWTRRRTF